MGVGCSTDGGVVSLLSVAATANDALFGGSEALSDGIDTIETARVLHQTAGSALTSIQLVHRNGSLTADGPDTISVTASIEYPAGTFTQVKWGGSSSKSLGAGLAGVSDAITVAIPEWTQYWVRTCVTVASGKRWYRSFATSGAGAGVTTGSDLTMSGTIGDSTSHCMAAEAVFGVQTTPQKTVICVGDSIGVGVGDSGWPSADNGIKGGIFGRAVVGSYFNFMWAKSGMTANAWLSSVWPKFSAYAAYADTVIVQLGSNDIGSLNGSADYTTIWTNFNSLGAKCYQCTCPPRSTSSDSWATTGNQTKSASDADRVSFNNALRAITTPHQGGSPLTGFIEVADAVESSRDSGLWRAPGWTADGIHPSNIGHPQASNAVALKLSGVVGVNYNSNTAFPGSSIANPAMVSVTGNAIVVWVRGFDAHPTGVADTAGNTYTLRHSNVGVSGRFACYVAQNIVGNAANVVTTTFAGSQTFCAAHVAEYSGLTTIPYDQAVSAETAGTSGDSGAFTPPKAPELAVGFAIENNAFGTFVATGGYVARTTDTLGLGSIMDSIACPNIAQNFTNTVAGAEHIMSGVLVLKISGVG